MLTIRKPMLLLSFGLFLTQGAVWAQGALRDPTMPPPGVIVPVANIADKGGVSEVVTETSQSVIRITPVGGRKQAVLDGRAMLSGEQLKQWRLMTINANGVVLKDSRGIRSVPLAPAASVSKKPVTGNAFEK